MQCMNVYGQHALNFVRCGCVTKLLQDLALNRLYEMASAACVLLNEPVRASAASPLLPRSVRRQARGSCSVPSRNEGIFATKVPADLANCCEYAWAQFVLVRLRAYPNLPCLHC